MKQTIRDLEDGIAKNKASKKRHSHLQKTLNAMRAEELKSAFKPVRPQGFAARVRAYENGNPNGWRSEYQKIRLVDILVGIFAVFSGWVLLKHL